MVLLNRLGKFVMLVSLTIFIFPACHPRSMEKEAIYTYAIRLKPGEDIKAGIDKLVREKDIRAGWIASCAGSLTDYAIRFANQPAADTGSGHFEIVSLSGTVSASGSHLHISISDSTGKTIGGHLVQGCRIYTTAEIIIQATGKYQFTREKDGTTDWEELQVREISNKE